MVILKDSNYTVSFKKSSIWGKIKATISIWLGKEIDIKIKYKEVS